jgi:hypothetical protein
MRNPPPTHRLSKRTKRLAISLAAACLGLLSVQGGCGKDKGQRRQEAPKQGVVGQVAEIQGEATWSIGPDGNKTSLKVGDEVRAEWTVHTSRGATLAVKLSNGHLWTLGEEQSKLVSTVAALTLPRVREGALAQVADLGGKKGTDRTSAAGLHHERTLGTKASPTSAMALEASEGERPRTGEASPPREEDQKPEESDKTRTDRGRSTKNVDLPAGRGPTRGAQTRPPTTRHGGRTGLGLKGLLGEGDKPKTGGALGGPGGGGFGSGPSAPRQKPALDSDTPKAPAPKAPAPKAPAPKAPAPKAPAPPPPPPPKPETAAARPSPSKGEEDRLSPESQPKDIRKAEKGQTLANRPALKDLEAALASIRPRVTQVLVRERLTGTLLVKLTVDGPSGRVTGVNVGTRPSTDPVCKAVLRAVANVAMPKARQPYTAPLQVKLP